MMLKTIVEKIPQVNEGNLVFKLKNTFHKGSVKVEVEGVSYTVKEMGDDIIKVSPTPLKGTTVNVSYEVQVPTYNIDIDIVKELRELQERCNQLERQNELLFQAVQERVPAKTFRQWLLVMEKNFGKSVLDSSSLLGIQGDSLPNEWKGL